MGLVKASDHAGGGVFFKPADHLNDLALLVEPKSIQKDVPFTTFDGKPSTRNEATADVSVFRDSGDINKGEPSAVMKNARITHSMLVNTCAEIVGQATIATLAKVKTKNGSGYVWRDASGEATTAVTVYFEGREAALQKALDDVPDFD